MRTVCSMVIVFIALKLEPSSRIDISKKTQEWECGGGVASSDRSFLQHDTDTNQ